MQYADVAIPLGAAWCSPFAKWQGTLAETSSLDLAAAVTERALADRGIEPTELTGLVLGWTVPQPDIFYGTPGLAARLGMPGVTGPMISQACATSVAALHAAAGAVDSGAGDQLVVATDRTSNGPALSWPAPSRQGGAPVTAHWVLDSFARDPGTGQGMLATGETVAAEAGFTRDEADAVAVLRSEQYASALADDRAFQRRYMVPVSIPGKRRSLELDADEGVRPVDAETAGKLPPATPEGIHTFASQTHPADGAAGAVVTPAERARGMGDGVVRLLGSGFARVAPAHMPQAPVPAAAAALASAGPHRAHGRPPRRGTPHDLPQRARRLRRPTAPPRTRRRRGPRVLRPPAAGLLRRRRPPPSSSGTGSRRWPSATARACR